MQDALPESPANALFSDEPVHLSSEPQTFGGQKPSDKCTENRLQFVGSGGEYFGIWIVNLFLSILTLGIYSAWAKVRREQYFHRNTLLDGSGFDYHGNPIAILKGRIIAVGFLFILSLIENIAPAYYSLALLLSLPLIPWILIRSFIFRSRNTSFRGLHFDFRGTYIGFCKAFFGYFLVFAALGWAVTNQFVISDVTSVEQYGINIMKIVGLAFLGASLLVPAVVGTMKRFQFNHLAFGASSFHIQCRTLSFYGVYLRVLLPLFALIGVLMLLILVFLGLWDIPLTSKETARGLLFLFTMPVAFVLIMFLFYLTVLLIMPAYLGALIANLVWNNTCLDKHRFVSNQTFWGITGVTLSNWLFILLTAGLFWPWAKVRLAAFRARHTAVLVAGSLDHFIAGASQKKSAIGEEIADVFDLDIAF